MEKVEDDFGGRKWIRKKWKKIFGGRSGYEKVKIFWGEVDMKKWKNIFGKKWI